MYKLGFPLKDNGDNNEVKSVDSRPWRVFFQENEPPQSSHRSASPLRIPDRDQFLRDWPRPPVIPIPNPDEADPFPLFHPNISRYFDQDEQPHSGDASRNIVHPISEFEDDTTTSVNGIVDKRFAYSLKGTIKDYFFLFKPLPQKKQQGDPGISNRLINQSGAGADQSAVGETDAWDEDDHTPVYWQHRMREVDYFVNNNLWSVDPIGDWSFLNENKVPKHFLRRLRRYFEIRPLEYLRDTGSYRMFHVINQYNDLGKFAENKKALGRARKMELDYLAMIWLSIWDPRLQENIWQLKEISMSDWFFSRTGWSEAIGVKELLTKNELHSMDNLWEHRGRKPQEKEEMSADIDALEAWMAEEEDEDDTAEQTGNDQPI